MRYLLDTCLFLWMLEGNRKKIKVFLDKVEDPQNDLLISVVSYWEIVIKRSLGKLEIADGWTATLEEMGVSWLLLEPAHLDHLEKLPPLHNDPFDRLLISQAMAEKIELLTLDKKILQYQCRSL